jgi:hypothetical protein
MRAKEFIIENTVQENPAYGLPTLDKHRYSVLDKLVKDAKKRDRITTKAIQSLDEEVILTEVMLYEGFLDSAKQYLGNKINLTSTDIKGAVVDMKSAGILIKDIIQNPDYLDKVNVQLYKRNNMLIKTITQLLTQNQTLANFWNKIKQNVTTLITNKGWFGFLSRLGIYGFLKYIVNIANTLNDNVIKTLLSKINILGRILSSLELVTMGGFLEIFESLKTVKKYFLDVLTSIKTKLMFKPKGVAESKIDEEIDDTKAAEVAKAVEWICKKLKIKDIPAIELSMDTDEAQGNHHTGGHVPGSGKIWVYARNRNLVDILRTIFHEIVHVRQHQDNRIEPNSSYPGSPIEVEADAVAGTLIKIWGAANPHIFE